MSGFERLCQLLAQDKRHLVNNYTYTKLSQSVIGCCQLVPCTVENNFAGVGNFRLQTDFRLLKKFREGNFCLLKWAILVGNILFSLGIIFHFHPWFWHILLSIQKTQKVDLFLCLMLDQHHRRWATASIQVVNILRWLGIELGLDNTCKAAIMTISNRKRHKGPYSINISIRSRHQSILSAIIMCKKRIFHLWGHVLRPT